MLKKAKFNSAHSQAIGLKKVLVKLLQVNGKMMHQWSKMQSSNGQWQALATARYIQQVPSPQMVFMKSFSRLLLKVLDTTANDMHKPHQDSDSPDFAGDRWRARVQMADVCVCAQDGTNAVWW